MTDQPITEIPTCVDSELCAQCPPDKVCAWACEQGWGMHEIAIERQLIAQGVIPAYVDPQEAVRQVEDTDDAMWDIYN